MKADLSGKTALITGAAAGIGQAIALRFARNGAKVVINDIDESGGRSVVEEIEADGGQSLFIETDVTQQEQVNQMVARIIEECGSIDILVNNAGINVGREDRVPVHEFSEHDWHRIIDVDLNGVFYCSKAVTKHMVRQKSGKIINISSVVGVVSMRLQIPFVAAKAAIVNMTKAMASELGPCNICVNCIAPGVTMTEGVRKLFYSDPKVTKSLLSHIPLGRTAEPDEMAGTALFLACKDSDYVTGQVITVDGGWTAGYARDW